MEDPVRQGAAGAVVVVEGELFGVGAVLPSVLPPDPVVAGVPDEEPASALTGPDLESFR